MLLRFFVCMVILLTISSTTYASCDDDISASCGKNVVTTLAELKANLASTSAELTVLGVGESSMKAPLASPLSCDVSIASLADLFGLLEKFAEQRGPSRAPHLLASRAECLARVLGDVARTSVDISLDYPVAKLALLSLAEDVSRVGCVAKTNLKDGLARCTLAAALSVEQSAVNMLGQLASAESASVLQSKERCTSAITAFNQQLIESSGLLGIGLQAESARNALSELCPTSSGLDALSAKIEPLRMALASFGSSDELLATPAVQLVSKVETLDMAFVDLSESPTCSGTDACVLALRAPSLPTRDLEAAVTSITTFVRDVDLSLIGELLQRQTVELRIATSQMQEMSQSFNLQYLTLQSQMQNENRQYTSISNIMKTKHDTVKNAISNLR